MYCDDVFLLHPGNAEFYRSGGSRPECLAEKQTPSWICAVGAAGGLIGGLIAAAFAIGGWSVQYLFVWKGVPQQATVMDLQVVDKSNSEYSPDWLYRVVYQYETTGRDGPAQYTDHATIEQHTFTRLTKGGLVAIRASAVVPLWSRIAAEMPGPPWSETVWAVGLLAVAAICQRWYSTWAADRKRLARDGTIIKGRLLFCTCKEWKGEDEVSYRVKVRYLFTTPTLRTITESDAAFRGEPVWSLPKAGQPVAILYCDDIHEIL